LLRRLFGAGSLRFGQSVLRRPAALRRADSLRSEVEWIGVLPFSSGAKTKSGRWARQVSFWSRRKTAADRRWRARLRQRDLSRRCRAGSLRSDNRFFRGPPPCGGAAIGDVTLFDGRR
jgi:hypothetical protein